MSAEMDIDKPLDELARRDGKSRGRRGGWTAPRKGPAPEEVAKMHGGDHRPRGRRGGGGSDKPGVVSVVFGNGTPEKVMTGRLTDSMAGGKGKGKAANLVQAALERGTQSFLRNHSKSSPAKGREKGGKRLSSTGGSRRKGNVIQHPLLHKLRIVRPSDPGYTRELRQLRNHTYAVRLTRNTPRSNASTRSAGSSASAGPMSKRFSSLSRK